VTDPSLERIGRYEIVRILGEGAMGRVLLARDPSLDRLVAVKTIRIQGLGEERVKAYLARFQNEARAAARLKHPNVVQVYDVGEDSDAGPYLVFEYVHGKPLGDMLGPGGIQKLEEGVRIVKGIAAALDAAHAAGIFHRDVKPDNVLVSEEGSVKLADFGVAHLSEAEMTMAGQFLGTPSYAAPEALARGECTAKTDQFSLAAVAFVILTGEKPFPGEGVAEVSHRVIHEAPRSPTSIRSDLPDAVADALLRGLAKDPDARYDSCGDLAAAVEAAALGHSAPPARAESRRVQVVLLTVALGLVASGWIALTYTIGRGAGNAGPDGGMDAGRAEVGGDRVAAPVIQPIIPPTEESSDRDDPDHRRSDAGAEAPSDAAPADAAAPITDAAAATDASGKDLDERVKDLLDEARRLADAGEAIAARAKLDEILRLDPGHPEARRLRDRLPDPPAPEAPPPSTASGAPAVP